MGDLTEGKIKFDDAVFLYTENSGFLSDGSRLKSEEEIHRNLSYTRERNKPGCFTFMSATFVVSVTILPATIAIGYVIITWLQSLSNGFDLIQTVGNVVGIIILSFGFWIGYRHINDVYKDVKMSYFWDISDILEMLYEKGETKPAHVKNIVRDENVQTILFSFYTENDQEKLSLYSTSSPTILEQDDLILVLHWGIFAIPL